MNRMVMNKISLLLKSSHDHIVIIYIYTPKFNQNMVFDEHLMFIVDLDCLWYDVIFDVNLLDKYGFQLIRDWVW